MFGVMIRPIRGTTAIWHELDCNTSTQKATVVVMHRPQLRLVATAVSPLASLNVSNLGCSYCRILDSFRELTINRLTIEIREEDLSEL